MAKKNSAESSVTEKIDALYNLQVIDSSIDKIRTIRGELPLEVQELEDEVAGLTTKLDTLNTELSDLETEISNRKNSSKDAKDAIDKYTEQQKNVRNNREFDAISKEIEFQGLEIELNDKKIKEAKFKIESKSSFIEDAKNKTEERAKDLEVKKNDLAKIIEETEEDEAKLIKKSDKAKKAIEERLVTAYERLRTNAINGLAVVSVERDSCGGCFNQIPPQRQLDIEARTKIIVCEHCGRILVEPPVDKKKK
jgi:predicted  nucleic acid-binding Zn-ribbon protein